MVDVDEQEQSFATFVLFALAMYLIGQTCSPVMPSEIRMISPRVSVSPSCLIASKMTEPPEIQKQINPAFFYSPSVSLSVGTASNASVSVSPSPEGA